MDIASNLRFEIKSGVNGSFVAYVDTVRNEGDDIGALYYVVAVVLIYGLSIVMMIASHIRKNRQDSQLRTYLKEMSILRKKDRREKLYTKMANITTPKLATKDLGNVEKNIGFTSQAPEPDDDSREMLLRKESNSDGTDSVFQYSGDDALETPKSAEPLKQELRTNVQIQVINENVPL